MMHSGHFVTLVGCDEHSVILHWRAPRLHALVLSHMPLISALTQSVLTASSASPCVARFPFARTLLAPPSVYMTRTLLCPFLTLNVCLCPALPHTSFSAAGNRVPLTLLTRKQTSKALIRMFGLDG